MSYPQKIQDLYTSIPIYSIKQTLLMQDFESTRKIVMSADVSSSSIVLHIYTQVLILYFLRPKKIREISLDPQTADLNFQPDKIYRTPCHACTVSLPPWGKILTKSISQAERDLFLIQHLQSLKYPFYMILSFEDLTQTASLLTLCLSGSTCVLCHLWFLYRSYLHRILQ